MKKYILVSALVMGMFGAFASTSQATQKAAKENKKEEYACPMKCEAKRPIQRKVNAQRAPWILNWLKNNPMKKFLFLLKFIY